MTPRARTCGARQDTANHRPSRTSSEETAAASAMPAWTDLVAPERRSPEYLAKFVVSEIDRWAAPIKASGVSLN
jgi:hypothetical protein